MSERGEGAVAAPGFADTVAAHQGILHRVCRLFASRPEDREDLMQDVLYELWRSWSGFAGRSKPTTWMYRVAVNTAITRRRREGRVPAHVSLEDLASEPPAPAPSGAEAARVAALYRAIAALKPVDRAVILLRLDGLGYREMSDILGITENALGVRLARARARLAARMEALS